jgi:choline dehydrogenase
MARSNLDVIGDALVNRLRITNGRCTGVEVEVYGARRTVGVGREAVLAAGAIGSPQQLMLSGIGPADHLRNLGIDIVANLPGVGQNLQDHVRSRVVYSAMKPTNIAAGGFCPVGALLHSDIAQDSAPDVFLLMLDFPLPPLPTDTGFSAMLPEPGYAITFSQHAPPASRGTIRLAGADARVPPIIDPCYYSADLDLEEMLEYLRLARRVGNATALDPWRRSEILPGADVGRDATLRDYIRRSSGSSFHPVGTCRIGTDPFGVVDAELRVHGVVGLRVADASVMPSIVSAGPNATVVAIAERAAEKIQSCN